jgi:hypothetical protein
MFPVSIPDAIIPGMVKMKNYQEYSLYCSSAAHSFWKKTFNSNCCSRNNAKYSSGFALIERHGRHVLTLLGGDTQET